MKRTSLPRRTFLKGVGTAMALPLFEAMTPPAQAASRKETAPPVRMAFVFVPNGAIMPNWSCEGEGADWTLSRTLTPLAAHKSKLSVFTGLTQHHGRANGDGAGDHARCAGSFLTGSHLEKTSGANIKVGTSVDQAAAKMIGRQTRLPSIELGIERGRNSGNCDSGYSCAYSANVSWKDERTPTAKEVNPKEAFERLFDAAESARGRAERDLYRRSILDLVAEDAALLRRRLGVTDQRKLDEYFNSVRELEVRIEHESTKLIEVPEYDVPEGIPHEVEQHIRLMYDIMTLAYQTDTTRISTFMLGNAGSNRSYTMIDVKGGHHSLSHHQNDAGKMEDITKIDVFLMQQFNYFLNKLDGIQEGEGTLLDNSLILYGSAIADANRHSHHDLPIVVAGSGGGQLATDRLRHYEKNTPLNNLFVSMCGMSGANLNELGDSTGPLTGLDS